MDSVEGYPCVVSEEVFVLAIVVVVFLIVVAAVVVVTIVVAVVFIIVVVDVSHNPQVFLHRLRKKALNLHQ